MCMLLKVSARSIDSQLRLIAQNNQRSPLTITLQANKSFFITYGVGGAQQEVYSSCVMSPPQ